jgi:hypothetical protein
LNLKLSESSETVKGSRHLLFEGVRVAEGRALGVVRGGVVVTVCLGRTSLVKDKISKRQLLRFIERTERL